MLENRWKIVALRTDDAPCRLYGLNADPTEIRDYSDAHPERTGAMADDWRARAREVGVARVRRRSVIHGLYENGGRWPQARIGAL